MGAQKRNVITLKGSTKIVSEFFAYAVNRCIQYHWQACS